MSTAAAATRDTKATLTFPTDAMISTNVNRPTNTHVTVSAATPTEGTSATAFQATRAMLQCPMAAKTLTSAPIPISTHATGYAQMCPEVSSANVGMEPMGILSVKEAATPSQFSKSA